MSMSDILSVEFWVKGKFGSKLFSTLTKFSVGDGWFWRRRGTGLSGSQHKLLLFDLWIVGQGLEWRN
jgi:hypothetical protein